MANLNPYKRYHYSSDNGLHIACIAGPLNALAGAGSKMWWHTDNPDTVTCMACRKTLKAKNMLEALPLPEIQKVLGDMLARKTSSSVLSNHVIMSITTYLKDARRWQYVRDHSLGAVPPEQPIFTAWVDDEIRKQDSLSSPPSP